MAAGRECYHCKQWIEDGAAHDCWTTTEGARKACYFFVRPKRRVLELCIFLDRGLKAPQVRRAEPSSRTKVANLIHISHRDEVEPPITDWMREAYDTSDRLSGRSGNPSKPAKRAKKRQRKASAK